MSKTQAKLLLKALPLVVFGAFVPSIATAELCTTRIEAVDLEIDPSVLDAQVSWREKLLSRPRLSGQRQCNSAEIYAFMQGLADLDGKCMAYADDDTGFVFLDGARNFRGRCTTTVCERVNDTKENLGLVTDVIVGTVVGIADTTATHPAGALVLSGASDTIISSIGTASASALAVLSTPSVLAATTVSAVAVGGAVYICSE